MRTRDIVKLVTTGGRPLRAVPHTHEARAILWAAAADVAGAGVALAFSPASWPDVSRAWDWPTTIDQLVFRIRNLDVEALGPLANRVQPDTLPDPAFVAAVNGLKPAQMAAMSHAEPYRAAPATVEALRAAGIWDAAPDGFSVVQMVAILVARLTWSAFWDFRLPLTDIELAARVFDFLRQYRRRLELAPPLTGAQRGLFDATPAAAPSRPVPAVWCRLPDSRVVAGWASKADAAAELRHSIMLDGVGRWGKHKPHHCPTCQKWHILKKWPAAPDPVSSDQ